MFFCIQLSMLWSWVLNYILREDCFADGLLRLLALFWKKTANIFYPMLISIHYTKWLKSATYILNFLQWRDINLSELAVCWINLAKGRNMDHPLRVCMLYSTCNVAKSIHENETTIKQITRWLETNCASSMAAIDQERAYLLLHVFVANWCIKTRRMKQTSSEVWAVDILKKFELVTLPLKLSKW